MLKYGEIDVSYFVKLSLPSQPCASCFIFTYSYIALAEMLQLVHKANNDIIHQTIMDFNVEFISSNTIKIHQ